VFDKNHDIQHRAIYGDSKGQGAFGRIEAPLPPDVLRSFFLDYLRMNHEYDIKDGGIPYAEFVTSF
jgi:hypothetical protein